MNKWAVGMLALASTQTFAAGPFDKGHVQTDVSMERYAGDLVGQDPHDRIFAARVIRTRVREAWRWAGGATDHLRAIEARQTLSFFDVLVAPRCTRQLTVPNVMRPCAQILGMLETKNALPALEDAYRTAQQRRDKRAIQTAIERIQSAQ